jgi:hypothetical protein
MTASANMNIESRVGYGPIKPAQGIYEESATQKAEIGYRILVGDRCFRYAYAGGTALIAGTLVNAAGWMAATTEVNLTVGTAAAVGTYLVPNVTSAAAWTTLAGGYMIVNDNGGEGQCYKIKSSSANADTSTSTDLVLYDPIETALTTSSQVELYTSPYYDLDISSAITDTVAGIPPIAVTANYYFWLQTWGPCAALVGATTASGDLLVPHTTNGSVAPGSVFTSNIIGFALTAGTATEYNGIFLRIAP